MLIRGSKVIIGDSSLFPHLGFPPIWMTRYKFKEQSRREHLVVGFLGREAIKHTRGILVKHVLSFRRLAGANLSRAVRPHDPSL